MSLNTTACGYGERTPCQVPFYFTERPQLVDWASDNTLALAAPVIAFWAYSLFFHYLDTRDWKWLEQYRIHESAEITSRNLVSVPQVVWAVILQHIIQTALGYVWMSDNHTAFGVNHGEKMRAIESTTGWLLGMDLQGKLPVYFIYWWGIPISQLLFGMFFMDTWQYALHRAMHVNKFLYRNFHSWHHRLYVPYAFGALYNHPVEGFLLDSLGAVLAEAASRMTTRQAILLFTISTLKTVDDHCGYRFAWDPLQMLTSNNADYHDIHHQTIGLKSNFSQPFFIHWDYILGTRMTREDIAARRAKTKEKTL